MARPGRPSIREDSPTLIQLPKDLAGQLDAMVADFGAGSRVGLIRHLVTSHHKGLVMIVNEAAKESLVGAAEERILKLVERKARQTVYQVLWEEGYRSDPYER